jgi:hypothetical protein
VYANLVKNYRKRMISVKIIQCDFLDFCFRFRLSQLKCTYDKK